MGFSDKFGIFSNKIGYESEGPKYDTQEEDSLFKSRIIYEKA